MRIDLTGGGNAGAGEAGADSAPDAEGLIAETGEDGGADEADEAEDKSVFDNVLSGFFVPEGAEQLLHVPSVWRLAERIKGIVCNGTFAGAAYFGDAARRNMERVLGVLERLNCPDDSPARQREHRVKHRRDYRWRVSCRVPGRRRNHLGWSGERFGLEWRRCLKQGPR